MKNTRRFLFLAVMCLAASACSSLPFSRTIQTPLATVEHVDLPRFMGRWYVISNIPYWGEKGYVGSYVEYSIRDDGDIDDIFFGRKQTFEQPYSETRLKDWVVNKKTNAEWRASPFWPVSFAYLILYVDPEYQSAIIGYPDRSLGWIFSRSPDISQEKLKELYGKLVEQGYDLKQFRRIPQKPVDIGADGYQ